MQKWTRAYPLQRCRCETGADEEQGRVQSEFGQIVQVVINRSAAGEIGVRHRGETEEQDEPGPLTFNRPAGRAILAAYDNRRPEGHGDDPEGAREFHGGADGEGDRAVLRSRADDGTGVVN